MSRKRTFGSIERLPSKRYRARYTGPDGAWHNAPRTFQTRGDAEAWLVDESRRISRGDWTPPKERKARARAATFGPYASAWLAARDVKPRTRSTYRHLLDERILPTFADVPLRAISPAAVRTWHASLDPRKATVRAHAYSLLRTILGTAVTDGEIPANPCVIRGAGAARRKKAIRPATLAELATLVEHLPPRYRAMALLATWCQLRFGELAELRRKDVDLDAGVLRVRRAAVRADGEVIIGTPKSAAGVRDVDVPPHLWPVLRVHLLDHVGASSEALLFPARSGGTMAPSALYAVFYPARAAAGRPDLRFHDLRHTGATMSAQAGATLAELMERLGHSTPAAALMYQHAAKGRGVQIAEALSRLAERDDI